jgi:hypothetical protein
MRVYLEGRFNKNFIPFEMAEFKTYFKIVRGSRNKLLRESNSDKVPEPPIAVTGIQHKTL